MACRLEAEPASLPPRTVKSNLTEEATRRRRELLPVKLVTLSETVVASTLSVLANCAIMLARRESSYVATVPAAT